MHIHVAITGAAAGLGRIVASTLLQRGRPVVILDQDDEQAHAAPGELSDQHGIQVPVIVADLGTITGIGIAAD